MPIIRTPDERFANLPGYDFAPHYAMINDVRVHYVDEGSDEICLCLHGEPSWSYLYRKMIPGLAGHFRVIAPDLVGFGKSDKYTETSEYSFQMHTDVIAGFLDALGLRDITLVCQDWGGLIGLRLAAEQPERFARLVIMNTGLPDGRISLGEGFARWKAFALRNPDLPVGRVIRSSLAHPETVPDDVIAAYEAPFPTAEYKAGAAIFPALIPDTVDAPGADAMRHAQQQLAQWTKPVLIMFSDKDPVTAGGDRFFQHLIPHAQHITIHDAGHFLQEEKGEELAANIVAFAQAHPLT